MGKPWFVRRTSCRIYLSARGMAAFILLICSFLCWSLGPAYGGQSSEDRTKGPVARYLLDTGQKQYERGFYQEAEKTLQQAQAYQQYLSERDRQRLNNLVKQAHDAALARREGLEAMRTAEELIGQNRPSEARPILQSVKDNKFLTAAERKRVSDLLAQTSSATSGPEAVVQGLRQASPFVQPQSGQGKPAAISTAPADTNAIFTAEQPTDRTLLSSGGGLMDDVIRRQNVIRDHVRAVISSTRVAVEDAANTGRFEGAEAAIAQARALLEANRLYLGQQLAQYYDSQLSQMARSLQDARDRYIWQQDQKRRGDAVQREASLRQQQQIDKQKAIIELMERAKLYLEEHRFDAAMAQVEAVLARDPTNDEALKLRQRIEDSRVLRQQLDLDREFNQQRADTTLRVQEAQIPYAQEVTYPKDWKALSEKPTRQPDKPVELDPANLEVYRQLDQIVDLSALNPNMPLSEAFDRIRNAVQPPLKLVVLWNDLRDNAEVDPTTPIGMDGLPEVRLGAALESLLAAVSSSLIQLGYPLLGYAVDSGIIRVATAQSLPRRMETRIYDVSDLVTEQSTMMPMGPMQSMMRMNMAQSLFYTSQDLAQQVAGGVTPSGGGPTTGATPGTRGTTTAGGLYGGGMYGGMMGSMGMMGGMGMMPGLGMGMMPGMGMGMGMMPGMGMGMGMMPGMGIGMGMMPGMGMGMGPTGYTGYRTTLPDMSMLTQLIQNTIEPDSWYDISEFGQGTIVPYPPSMMGQLPKRLAITNTREVHTKIERLLDELRKSLGAQVSIEARFLTVSKAFMEEIGLDMDSTINLGGRWGQLQLLRDISGSTPVPSEVTGSMGNIGTALLASGQYGTVLDDLQVQYLLRASQARNDTKTLSAPRATVMSGEPAIFNLANYFQWALPPESSFGYQPGLALGAVGVTTTTTPQYTDVITGNSLQITPTISKDKKHVILTIDVIRARLVGARQQDVEWIAPTATGANQVVRYRVSTPETEAAQLSTRVMVPDGGTLLLGGQTVTSESQKEVGVPILSKIPIIGRAFSSQSTVKDQQIMLVLVKPRIILMDEKDQEALAEAEARVAHPF